MKEEIPVNSFKRAIASGRLQIGLWCSLSSHLSVEVVAGSGFDWLLLDTEHSPNELPMVHGQLQAAAASPSHPVVRVPWNDTVVIKRYLDIGTQSFLIPYVQNAEEAARAVAAMHYAPRGMRGVAGVTRASRFGTIADQCIPRSLHNASHGIHVKHGTQQRRHHLATEQYRRHEEPDLQQVRNNL